MKTVSLLVEERKTAPGQPEDVRLLDKLGRNVPKITTTEV
jgi:hypothetical protein